MFKITLEKDQNLWVTSDTHYYHLNLCSATTKWRKTTKMNDGEVISVIPDNVRKFSSIDEMNNTIVNNINNDVKENDILLCLGDWSFNGFERIKEFRDRILCKNIYLVLGNHDERIRDNVNNIQSIFSYVVNAYDEMEVKIPIYDENKLITYEKYKFIVSHYPISSWNSMAKGMMHLFGHVHLPPHQKIMRGKAMDVGMDGNNYKPYNIEEIISTLKDRGNYPTVLPADHHADEWTSIKN